MAFSRNHALTAVTPDDPAYEIKPSDWNAGHALTDAVSGGVPYFSSTTAEGTSALLAANAVVIGGGAGSPPATLAALGTSGWVLTSQGAGSPPVFAAAAGGGITIGTTTITSGTAGRILFHSAAGDTVAESSTLTYSATGSIAGGPLVTTGSTGADVGWFMGSALSGYAGLWASSSTPSLQNAVVIATADITYLNANSAGAVYLSIDASVKVTVNAAGFNLGNAKLLFGTTAPTIASGGCTSPTVTNSSGTAYFTIDVGTGCSGSQPLVFTLPAATTGWICWGRNVTNGATIDVQQTGAISTTSATFTGFSRTLGTAVAWTDGDDLSFGCHGG